MGNFTYLHPTILCSKESWGLPVYTYAPPLWLSMFSLADVFIEKSEDGENYACAETTVKKAQDRLRRIQEAIKGNEYLEAILAPLEFFQTSLSNSNEKDTVGFDLAEFQSFDGDWGPSCAMTYLGNIESVIEAFDIIIGGGSLTKAFKLFSNSSILFNGSIEKDRKVLKMGMKKWKDNASNTLYENAFQCLMGGPCGACSPQEKEAGEQYYSWIEQRKNIWEGDKKGKIKGKQKVSLNETGKEPEIPNEETKESPVEVKKFPRAEKIRDGLVKEYNEDGKLEAELHYTNGTLDGRCRYYKGKELCRELNYKNGKRNGLCKYWEDGYIRSISNFRNDRLNGVDKYFEYETKELLEENIFKNGKVIKKLKVENS